MYYDPLNNEWTMLHRPQWGHKNAPLLAWRERILLGGGKGSTSIEQYNPEADEWDERHQSMPAKIWGHQMLCVDLC